MYIESILAAAIPLCLSLYVRLTFQVSIAEDGSTTVRSVLFNRNPPLSPISIILLALSEFVVFYYFIATFGLTESLLTLALSIIYILFLYTLVSSAVFALQDEQRAFSLLITYMIGSIMFVGAVSYEHFVSPALKTGLGMDGKTFQNFAIIIGAVCLYLIAFLVISILGYRSKARSLLPYVAPLCLAHAGIRISLLIVLPPVVS